LIVLGHRRCYSGSKHRNARLSLERFWFHGLIFLVLQ